ncbi:MAG: hypothetical protein H6575_10525 [Lewinellaceae bacterium]|nr:hypothetical protein [Saprospiraceae bacterium]MCB0542576.1 hypothetical protein [Saprospiraceae bacterium]MCB9354988.1 hypothetical protein [Lewinellaceae bacterium]
MRTIKTLLLTFTGCLFLASCMRSTTLTVLQPAQMKLPEHISKVAVVDRSKPSSGWLNVLEGLFTGEAIGQDRRSRQEAVAGLTDALTRTPRFRVISTGVEMTGSKAGNNLPPPLEWEQIERICGDYDADAVAAIESFDSDNFINVSKETSRKKDKNGKSYTETYYDARQRTGVRIGWRLYDPKTRVILDEFVTDDYLERSARGNTDNKARQNLPSQVSITRDVAFNVGLEYGARIAPVYVNVKRNYYKKAKGYESQMDKAARYAQGEDWDHAAEIWKKIAESAGENTKAAGRAAYNMAVAAEIKGNLELALEWAQKAWNDYGNKMARDYIQVIRQRQNDARKLEYQLPGKRV